MVPDSTHVHDVGLAWRKIQGHTLVMVGCGAEVVIKVGTPVISTVLDTLYFHGIFEFLALLAFYSVLEPKSWHRMANGQGSPMGVT